MRNEVWVMDIAAKVREDIDDPLAQDLVIGVCLSLMLRVLESTHGISPFSRTSYLNSTQNNAST